jgi:hypothetical protein
VSAQPSLQFDSEYHERHFGGAIALPWGGTGVFPSEELQVVEIQLAENMRRASRKENSNVAVRRLYFQERGEKIQEVKMRKVVDSEMCLDAVPCGCARGVRGRHQSGATHDRIQAARRGVIDEFGCKLPDAIQIRQITLLRVDQLVTVARS